MEENLRVIEEDSEKEQSSEIKIIEDVPEKKEVSANKTVTNIILPEWSIDVPLEIKRGTK